MNERPVPAAVPAHVYTSQMFTADEVDRAIIDLMINEGCPHHHD